MVPQIQKGWFFLILCCILGYSKNGIFCKNKSSIPTESRKISEIQAYENNKMIHCNEQEEHIMKKITKNRHLYENWNAKRNRCILFGTHKISLKTSKFLCSKKWSLFFAFYWKYNKHFPKKWHRKATSKTSEIKSHAEHSASSSRFRCTILKILKKSGIYGHAFNKYQKKKEIQRMYRWII